MKVDPSAVEEFTEWLTSPSRRLRGILTPAELSLVERSLYFKDLLEACERILLTLALAADLPTLTSAKQDSNASAEHSNSADVPSHSE
jgi:hypothetical protein